jgi:hypothetical protein
MTKKNWIVIVGSIVDSTQGGGYEFIGPFTEAEATEYRKHVVEHNQKLGAEVYGECVALQLLSRGERWLAKRKGESK